VIRIKVLYFDGCPSHEQLLPRLRHLLEGAGFETAVELHRVETVEAAEAERFLGSPTVRVDGRDVEPGAEARTDFGLKCRLYRGPGGVASTPPDDWVIEAVEASARVGA
jgi:hypothetical protein